MQKTHLNENYFWLGIHIHKNTPCFPTDLQHENVIRLKPLLFEWEVTSTQITSGHNMNNRSAGKIVQAMAIIKYLLETNYIHSILLPIIQWH